MAEKCTNTSSPVDRWIKPYPLAPLNHLTVPFSLTTALLSLLYIGRSPRACFLRRAGAQPKPAGTNDGGVPEWEQAGPSPGSAAGSRVSPGNAAERQRGSRGFAASAHRAAKPGAPILMLRFRPPKPNINHPPASRPERPAPVQAAAHDIQELTRMARNYSG